MEASKRERIILFGVVPVVAAVVGAIVTVVIGHITNGSGNQSEIMMEIVKSANFTFEQKQALMKIADQNSARFYSWLSSVGMIILLIVGFAGPSIAQRIRG